MSGIIYKYAEIWYSKSSFYKGGDKMIYISFDKLIEILSPLLVVVCIAAFVGLNKAISTRTEQILTA